MDELALRRAHDLESLVRGITSSTVDWHGDLAAAEQPMYVLIAQRQTELRGQTLGGLTGFFESSPPARELFLNRLAPVMLADLQREAKDEETRANLERLCELRDGPPPVSPTSWSATPDNCNVWGDYM